MPENSDFKFQGNPEELPDKLHMDLKDSRPEFFKGDKVKIAELAEAVDRLTKRVQILESQVRTLQRPDPSSLIVGEDQKETAERLIQD